MGIMMRIAWEYHSNVMGISWDDEMEAMRRVSNKKGTLNRRSSEGK